jgi:subtilisin family serine protease
MDHITDAKIALLEHDKAAAYTLCREFSRSNLQLTPFFEVEPFCQIVSEFRPDVVICDGFTLEPANVRMYPLLRKLKLDSRIILASQGLLRTPTETKRRFAAEQGVQHFWDKTDNRYQLGDDSVIETVALKDLVLRMLAENKSRRRLGSQLMTLTDFLAKASDVERQKETVKNDGWFENGIAFLPISISANIGLLAEGETWQDYRKRAGDMLDKLALELKSKIGGDVRASIAGNSLSCHASTEVIEKLAQNPEIKSIGLRRRVRVSALDVSAKLTGFEPGSTFHGRYTGKGVRVAVIDSGIDREHPCLKVDEYAVCYDDEAEHPAGMHGTMVGGVLVSQHPALAGFIPDAHLICIKAMSRDGYSDPGPLSEAIDEALIRQAQVIVLAVGMNYLDQSLREGHGGNLENDDNIPLQNAVLNAIGAGVVVVAAAGNHHETAEAARGDGASHLVGTELLMPGILDEVITVGAVDNFGTKLATFSSQGLSLKGAPKPEIVAPGVGIQSTIPAPRDKNGRIKRSKSDKLFAKNHGTSFATPMVAAAVAMLIQKRKEEGKSWTPADIKEELLRDCVRPLSGEPGTGHGILTFP